MSLMSLSSLVFLLPVYCSVFTTSDEVILIFNDMLYLVLTDPYT